MLDERGEECLIVVKNGNTTSLTFGCATGIESFVREYVDYEIRSTSMELAIYPYSHKDGAFSAAGDSGSVIADADKPHRRHPQRRRRPDRRYRHYLCDAILVA